MGRVKTIPEAVRNKATYAKEEFAIVSKFRQARGLLPLSQPFQI